MNLEQKFFFVHLQKTGGTALWRRLQKQFSPEQLYPGPNDGEPPENTLVVEDLVERWPSRREQVVVIAGHFPLCTASLLGEEFTTLTTLRHPVDRILSSLRNQAQTVVEQDGVSLEDIYHQPLRHQILHNHMVKMFSLGIDEMTDGALTYVDFTRDHLDRAKEELETIDVVGLQEDFESFCDDLTSRFGWDLGKPIFMNRTEPMDVSQNLRDMLAEENALDIEFYEFARDLCRRRSDPLR